MTTNALSLISYSSYQVLPSAFQLIERPLSWLNGEDNKIKHAEYESFLDQITKLSEKHTNMQNLDRIISGAMGKVSLAFNQHRFFDVFSLSFSLSKLVVSLYASFFKGMVLLSATSACKNLILLSAVSVISTPIVLLTPLTIIADPIIGIFEAAIAKCKNVPSEQIRLILQKKCVSSPLQQLTFLVLSVFTTTIIAGAVFATMRMAPQSFLTASKASIVVGVVLGGSFFNLKCYQTAQMIIGNHFPQWAKPDDFNVFIDGGAPNEDGQKFTKKAENHYQHYKKNYGDNYSEGWEKYVTDLGLPANPPLRGKSKLLPFLTLLQENPTASLENILGIQGEVTAEKIKEARKKLSLDLHPDKNPDVEEKELADKLFKAMCQACVMLENNCH